MGYSISVTFSDSQEREQMQNFLFQNKDLLDQLKLTEISFPEAALAFMIEPIFGENLNYCPDEKSFILGFHGDIIPRYMPGLCAWMACKSTYRDKKRGMFFYYHDEKMRLTFDKNSTQYFIIDQDGIEIHERVHIDAGLLELMNGGNDIKKQKEILSQLNNNWNEYQLSLKNNNQKPKNL